MMLVLRVTLACSVALAASCQRERATPPSPGNDPPGTTSLRSADVRASVDAAVDRIAAARCDREVTCDKIGGAKRYPSLEACQALMRTELHDGLSFETCPRGVNADKVADCVAANERADCYSPIDALVRLRECRASHICY